MKTSETKEVYWISFKEWKMYRDWYARLEAPFRYMNEDIKFW